MTANQAQNRKQSVNYSLLKTLQITENLTKTKKDKAERIKVSDQYKSRLTHIALPGTDRGNARNAINNADVKVPQRVSSAKEMARPVIQDAGKGANDAKLANANKQADLRNNNLFKVHFDNKNNEKNVPVPKDKGVKPPIPNVVKKEPVANVAPAVKAKEVVTKPKEIKPAENVSKRIKLISYESLKLSSQDS